MDRSITLVTHVTILCACPNIILAVEWTANHDFDNSISGDGLHQYSTLNSVCH